MLIRLHRLRDHGVPIPRYQFAFKATVAGELVVHEERDALLNRHTRVARLRDIASGAALLAQLFDVQLVELTRERMVLSGLERVEDQAILKVQDFAQTWVCWLEATDTSLS